MPPTKILFGISVPYFGAVESCVSSCELGAAIFTYYFFFFVYPEHLASLKTNMLLLKNVFEHNK